MNSTNIDTLEVAAKKFQELNVDDRLAVLALVYGEISDEVAPTTTQSSSQDEGAINLVKQVQNSPAEKQVDFLRGLLSGIEGEGASDYNAMSSDCKLSFWFQAAQNLGKSIVGVPADYIPTEPAAEVLELLHTHQLETLVSFLKKAL